MKTLKFTPELAQLILAGKKMSTWRLFDDKNLQVGDTLQFVNKATQEAFGGGEILGLRATTLGELNHSDFKEHNYKDSEEMYSNLRKYYGDRVTPETEVKIIQFNFSHH